LRSYSTARRPQRERPLVVVFRHLGELFVLDDLEDPEADGKDGECHDHADLQRGEPDGNAPAIFLKGHMRLPLRTFEPPALNRAGQ
jgi:hypothetical protein